jgi:hypothetical protein
MLDPIYDVIFHSIAVALVGAVSLLEKCLASRTFV